MGTQKRLLSSTNKNSVCAFFFVSLPTHAHKGKRVFTFVHIYFTIPQVSLCLLLGKSVTYIHRSLFAHRCEFPRVYRRTTSGFEIQIYRCRQNCVDEALLMFVYGCVCVCLVSVCGVFETYLRLFVLGYLGTTTLGSSELPEVVLR